jgi:hypothetical protein
MSDRDRNEALVHTGQAIGWYRCDGKDCPICGLAEEDPCPLCGLPNKDFHFIGKLGASFSHRPVISDREARIRRSLDALNQESPTKLSTAEWKAVVEDRDPASVPTPASDFATWYESYDDSSAYDKGMEDAFNAGEKAERDRILREVAAAIRKAKEERGEHALDFLGEYMPELGAKLRELAAGAAKG